MQNEDLEASLVLYLCLEDIGVKELQNALAVIHYAKEKKLQNALVVIPKCFSSRPSLHIPSSKISLHSTFSTVI